ncbi:MAG TPA: hypothetical protein VMR41_01330 [Patescibacteria group bacterium]|nr:hypothetical protein [Patescibacteria group bacterium]
MISINFLDNQDKNPFDKFVAWALSYGRTIIIATEIIAMAAFLLRFGLDNQLLNLHDQIKQEESIVAADESNGNEATYRNLQNRLVVAKNIHQQSGKIIDNLFDTIKQANGNVTFLMINESNNSLTLHVLAASTYSLSTFLNSLENLPFISSITIGSITTQPQSQQIDVNIYIALNN